MRKAFKFLLWTLGGSTIAVGALAGFHAVKLDAALRTALDPTYLGDRTRICSHSLSFRHDAAAGTTRTRERPTDDATGKGGARAAAGGEPTVHR